MCNFKKFPEGMNNSAQREKRLRPGIEPGPSTSYGNALPNEQLRQSQAN